MVATPAYMRLAHMDPAGVSRQPAHPRAAMRDTTSAGDIEARIAAAHKDGMIAGRAAAEEELGHKQALLEAVHTEEMRQLVDEQVAALARAFEAGRERMRDAIAASTMALLRPLIERSIAADSFAALEGELRNAIERASAATIVVQGPHALVERLQAEFGAHGHTVRFEETDGIEARLAIDRTLVETRIGDWLKLIEAAI